MKKNFSREQHDGFAVAGISTLMHKWSRTCDDAIHRLRWNTLETRRKIQICRQTFRIINHLDCIPFDIPFDSYFRFNTFNSTRSHALTLCFKSSRINSFIYTFFINAPILRNALPYDVASSTSLTSFKLTKLSVYKLYFGSYNLPPIAPYSWVLFWPMLAIVLCLCMGPLL